MNTYVFDKSETDRSGTGRSETDNDAMHHHLAAMYDPFSRRRLADAHLPPDARCLVIAVGASTIATTLADLVPDGEIVATDRDPRRCPDDTRVDLRRHDIVSDPPLPGSWDLIHVRLLLGHLPQRLEVLGTLAGRLNPGGALIVEEFEGSWRHSVLATADPEADRLFAAYHDAFAAVLTAAGNDLAWSRRVHDAMLRLGLDTETQGYTRSWGGGTAGCLLPRATAGAIRNKLVEAGMSGADIDDFRELLLDPRLRIKGNLALSTLGRRPRLMSSIAGHGRGDRFIL